jgi:hypothetical protein
MCRYLYVDADQHVHFTTASSPDAAALFSVCQVRGAIEKLKDKAF